MAQNGQIVVARIDDEVTVKRFQRHAKGVSLHAENPDFKTIEVAANHDRFFIEGLAVGIVRSW